MKKLINYFIELWKAETPIIARMAQAVSGAVAAAALSWGQLPDEWKASIPAEWQKWAAAIGICAAVLLQFTKKKD